MDSFAPDDFDDEPGADSARWPDPWPAHDLDWRDWCAEMAGPVMTAAQPT